MSAEALGNLTEILNQSFEIGEEFVEAKKEEETHYAFRIGNIGLILPTEEISEIIESPQYALLPKMPDSVVGLCNVRGNLMPVFDLHQYFGVKRVAKNSHLLAIGSAEILVGILVDVLPFRVKDSETELMANVPELPVKLQPYISKVYKRNKEIFVQYEHEQLFQALC